MQSSFHFLDLVANNIFNTNVHTHSRTYTRARAHRHIIHIYLCMYISQTHHVRQITPSLEWRQLGPGNGFSNGFGLFLREPSRLQILQIYVTSKIFLTLMISFSNFPRRDCFIQVCFEQRKQRDHCLNLYVKFLIQSFRIKRVRNFCIQKFSHACKT